MSKMRKEYDPNKVKRRKRKPIVYIICEGKETDHELPVREQSAGVCAFGRKGCGCHGTSQ